MVGMSLFRLIDAACNRAGEGVRTLEDLARFVLDDAAVTTSLKQLRHDLRDTAMIAWPCSVGVWSRDTSGDVGTSISTVSEQTRGGLGAIAAAAGRRAAEAIRSLEEAAKLDSPEAASTIESLRYVLYDLAAVVEQRLGASPVPQWRVCLLLTKSTCRLPWQDVLTASIDGGVDVVQLREKSLGDAELVQHVRAVLSVARGIPVIVNDRVDIAMAAGAAGVHLGQDDLSVRDARRQCGRHLFIGVSTHGPTEVAAAVEAGADYVGIGPIFASHTRPDLEPAGTGRVGESLPLLGHLPHLAIGGVSPENVAEVAASGARGVAVGRGICGVDDPLAAAQVCTDALGGIPA